MAFVRRLPALPGRVLNAVAKRWAPEAWRASLWEREYADRRWAWLDGPPEPTMMAALERYAHGGDILDLGCGAGSTAAALPPALYGRYVGVDISATAVRTAAEMSEQVGRAKKNEFVVADLGTYEPRGSFDLILLRESLYYTPFYRVPRLLDRDASHLSPGGVFVVRMYDRRKFVLTVRAIEWRFRVIEKHTPRENRSVLMVFAPRRRGEGRDVTTPPR